MIIYILVCCITTKRARTDLSNNEKKMRKIYLPELLSIHLRNYTLYPNGLDYTFDFIKGVNLVLGGNGMGKTTFVNLIKYAIIGNYKKQYDYTRTYKEKSIEKRIQQPERFYSNRMPDDCDINLHLCLFYNFYVKNRKLDIFQ